MSAEWGRGFRVHFFHVEPLLNNSREEGHPIGVALLFAYMDTFLLLRYKLPPGVKGDV